MTINQYLAQLCQLTGLEEDSFKIDQVEESDRLRIKLTLPDSEASLFIGSRGETLEAIELMLRLAFQDELADQRIIFDINDYQQQKEERLKEKAIRIGQRIQETGHDYVFSFLNSYERYLIHSTISENPELEDIETVSEGEGEDRVLRMRLKGEYDDKGSSQERAQSDVYYEDVPQEEEVSENEPEA